MSLAWPSRDGQFLISRASAGVPAGATRHRVGSLAVDVFGALPVVPLRDGSERLVGLLLGTPIDLEVGTLPAALTTQSRLTHESVGDFVEREVYRLAGSFIFVLEAEGCRRIYLDADGSKSLVYDPVEARAGATAMTLMDEQEYRDRLRLDLHRRLGVDQAGWFPAGLTAHQGICRLTCNHYLDLDSWTAHRHWPRAAIQEADDPAPAFDAMLGRIRRTVEVLRGAGDVHVALTAGTDSRFILSGLRPDAPDVQFVTVAAPAGALDVAGARTLSDRFGLRHQVLPYRRATRAEADAWQIRAGHCITGANMFMHPSVRPLAESFFVGGLGGEIGRGFLWLTAGPDTPIDARAIVDRLKFPREAELIEAVDAWLAPIAHLDTLLKLDLAYLELRMSSWGFADAYANPVRGELHPMISRANYAAMLAVPWQKRRDGTVFRDAIARAWPELLELPINRYGDWRDAAKRIADVMSNPRRAARKIRQIVMTRGQAA